MSLTPKQIVKIYESDEDGNITSLSATIDEAMNIEIIGGIEKTKDIASFEVPVKRTQINNWENRVGLQTVGDQYIRINDVVAIFVTYNMNGNVSDDNLLFMGSVKDFTHIVSENGNKVKISCINRTEELLRGMAPYTTVSSTEAKQTAPTILINLMNRLNNHNKNHKIYAVLDTATIYATGTVGSIQSKKKDNSVFATVSYNATWKPVFLQIETISSQEITEDEDAGQYISYVKPVPSLAGRLDPETGKPFPPYVDVLIWKSPSVDFSGSFVEGSNISTFSINKDVRDVVNAMIVNAGKDMYDNGILTVAYDLTSMAESGTKWKYYTASQKKFSNLLNNERTLSIGQGSVWVSDTLFPPTGSFPWTHKYDGSSVSSDEGSFNTNMRNKAKEEAKSEAEKFISRNKNAKYEIIYDLPLGSNNFQAGNVYYYQIPSIGWEGTEDNPGKLLRLRDVTHVIDRSGWQTRLVAREDEQLVQLQVEGKV